MDSAQNREELYILKIISSITTSGFDMLNVSSRLLYNIER